VSRFLLLASLLFVGCGSAVVESLSPAPAPTPTPTVIATVQGTPTATSIATALRFPTAAQVQLEPGRYSSQPPFDIAFTFEIPTDGWESGHLHGEFFDVLKLDSPGAPSRWIAFAHPNVIHGRTEAPGAGLTPQAAFDTLATLEGLDVGPTVPFEIAGVAGVAADLRATGPPVALFGGENGDFELNSELDLRLGIVPVDDALMLVLVMAPPGELDAALTEAGPILDSVELAAP
jgi:hypothetical protein